MTNSPSSDGAVLGDIRREFERYCGLINFPSCVAGGVLGVGQYRDYSLAYHDAERGLSCLRIIKRQIKNRPARKLK